MYVCPRCGSEDITEDPWGEGVRKDGHELVKDLECNEEGCFLLWEHIYIADRIGSALIWSEDDEEMIPWEKSNA